jgi:heavy metal translocating P-type ATPase
MKCVILHESKGRIRIHAALKHMTFAQADKLQYYLLSLGFVTDAKVYERTCDAVINYSGDRRDVISALARFSMEHTEVAVPDHTGRELNAEFEDRLITTIIKYFTKKLIFPFWLRTAINIIKSIRYISKGINSLLHGRLDVAVLDATSISVSMLRADFSTAGSIMFLLTIGDILEEWTHKKSVDDLARTMSLNIEKAWIRTADGQEVLMPLNKIGIGDLVIVRTGCMIPLDGKVAEGEAMVNQSSMTGESIPVHKSVGSYVYAGTAVEEGECIVRVEKEFGSGRYDRIITMIEESEKLKSDVENKAASIADGLVPYSLGGTVLTYLLTRNVTKALSVLMVDFSCALKLVMPITMLSAMKEAGQHGMTVKGGKFLETVADADTIIFDKTGTLTYAQPKVVSVVPFGGKNEDDMLRIAACLEEHYPHSMANAVVEEARLRGLDHEEMHSKVEYVVAHGISSEVNGEKVVIGSYHFTFQDEGCVLPDGEQERFDALPNEYSHLYMAIGGIISAVICIDDPLREEAADVIRQLKELGISKVVMMTGDSERMARSVAGRVKVDEYHAEVLPEDKAAFVQAEHEKGRKVIMIGDGVNDSLALSEADVGIAINDGAAIAREIADITISADDLYSLVIMRRLSLVLMQRIKSSYYRIIGFNFSLIVLGVLGVFTPAVSALLHNTSTVLFSMYGMTNLLPESDDKK